MSPRILRCEGALAHLRFNRPERLNAIDAAPEVRVVLISGDGRAFMAGATSRSSGTIRARSQRA